MMDAILHLWNEWEVQILVLTSFALQMLLLMFARMRRHNISRMIRILLWLMYLLADSTAIYALGHMSINCKSNEHHQLMAFWAPFLLVHLGGQDTITAYAMEDNQLWLRHLLIFAVQALEAGYVLYKNIGRHGPIVISVVLMFLVGFLQNVERVWAAYSSTLGSIIKLLDNIDINQNYGNYYARGQVLDDEVVLQGAHDMIYICLGQFVDGKVSPSLYQMDAIKLFHDEGHIYVLIEMQLSLMYDSFYTKAAVIHTKYGCFIRVVSLYCAITAFFLFQSITVKDGFNRVDVIVTYILLVGASLLEIVSVLRSMASTWTCAMLKARNCDRLHKVFVYFRRCVRGAQRKRWSGSIGQQTLVDYSTKYTSTSSSFSGMISMETKKLVLNEISRMVQACNGKESILWSYRGQCTLERHGLLEELTWSLDMEFDEMILTWHLATNKLLRPCILGDRGSLAKATKTLSNYMMFLFVEHPYMLPPPVRPRLYVKTRKYMKFWSRFMREGSSRGEDGGDLSVLEPGVNLVSKLFSKELTVPVDQVLFGVWVEMLCYAAHHCSRDSHARQLNSGGDFITVAWLLTTAEFNRVYYREEWFKKRKRYRFPSDELREQCQLLLRWTGNCLLNVAICCWLSLIGLPCQYVASFCYVLLLGAWRLVTAVYLCFICCFDDPCRGLLNACLFPLNACWCLLKTLCSCFLLACPCIPRVCECLPKRCEEMAVLCCNWIMDDGGGNDVLACC